MDTQQIYLSKPDVHADRRVRHKSGTYTVDFYLLCVIQSEKNSSSSTVSPAGSDFCTKHTTDPHTAIISGIRKQNKCHFSNNSHRLLYVFWQTRFLRDKEYLVQHHFRGAFQQFRNVRRGMWNLCVQIKRFTLPVHTAAAHLCAGLLILIKIKGNDRSNNL